jgi:hypothetical protein
MKPRGWDSIYQRGGVWWIKFDDRTGRCRRESSKSANKNDATRLLDQRSGEVESGKRVIGSDLERTSFEDLASMIRDVYRAENRRSTHRLEIGLKRLAEFFAGLRARDIDFSSLRSYRLARERKARRRRPDDGSSVHSAALSISRSVLARPNVRPYRR